MKKKNILAKTLLAALSILCLAAGFGQNTLHARAAAVSGYACENLGPDTHPDDFSY